MTDNPLGPDYYDGLAKGFDEGRAQGYQEGFEAARGYSTPPTTDYISTPWGIMENKR